MSVIVPRFTTELSQAEDIKQAILKKVGDLSDLELVKDQVLVATYIRPEKTKGGIFLTENSISEDVWQGKVGLVLAYGEGAFNTDEFFGMVISRGDWVVYRTGDTWSIDVRGVPCRVISDAVIKMRVSDPSIIF